MEPLIQGHARMRGALVGLAALMQFFYLKLIEPSLLIGMRTFFHGDKVKVDVFLTIASSTSIFGGIVAVGMLVYERRLWPRLYARFDFQGTWRTDFSYPGAQTLKPKTGTATITQTWYGDLTMSGRYGSVDQTHEDTAFWYSISCRALPNAHGDPERIFFAYQSGHATLAGVSEFAHSGHDFVAGVEQLLVRKRDAYGRPVIMDGTFHYYDRHSAAGAAPLRSGRSTWVRAQHADGEKGRKARQHPRRAKSAPKTV